MIATVFAGALSVGTLTTPSLAAGGDSSGEPTAKTKSSTTAEQTARNTGKVEQDSGTKVLPHKTYTYTGTNKSAIEQQAENTSSTTAEAEGDLKTKNKTTQDASNAAKVEQGTMTALPHSTLYYDGANYSTIEQDAQNTTTTVTKSNGNVKSTNSVKQQASNTAEVEQGTVKALPHSTVYYEGINESYIRQDAENTDTTVTEAGGTADVRETVEQDTSNTADVQQGVVKEFKHSTVYHNNTGSNTSVVEQSEKNTDN
ncbi:hypothetical protein [Kocuria arenosa]|uniref:hypothetical protein n=1 Tax=Kocuria arenosa TaxID=3071446 RepID=UPI0034D4306C